MRNHNYLNTCPITILRTLSCKTDSEQTKTKMSIILLSTLNRLKLLKDKRCF